MTTHTPRTLGMLPGILREARLAWRLWRDRRVPWWTKGVPVLSLLYIIWPLDFLSDPLLGLGQLDDLGVILLGISLFISLAPSDLVATYRGEQPREEAPEAAPEAVFEGAAAQPQEAAPQRRAIRTTYRFVDPDEPPA